MDSGATRMQLEVLAPAGAHPHTTRLHGRYRRLGDDEIAREPLDVHEPDLARSLVGSCDVVTCHKHLGTTRDAPRAWDLGRSAPT